MSARSKDVRNVGGSEGWAGGANYPAGKIPWHMPANGESRGDARDSPLAFP